MLRSTSIVALFAGALGALAGESERARELLTRVAEGDAKVARRSLGELKAMGKSSEPALLESWADLPAPFDQEALVLLVERKSEAAMTALEAAADSPKVEVRRLAVAMVANLREPFLARVTQLLCRSLRDADPETSDGAAGALRTWAFEQAWRPLLQSADALLVSGKGMDRVRPRIRALAAILTRHPSELRVLEVMDRASGCDDPAMELAWLGVLVESQCAPAFATLRQVHAACLDPQATEIGLSISTELRALAIRGLAADPESQGLVLSGVGDGAVEIRRESLRALRALPLVEPRRSEVIDEVVGLLVDPDPSLRQEAHRWLKQVTKQDLPLSLVEWQRWSGQNCAEVRLAARLDRWAQGLGETSFAALLRAGGYSDRQAWLSDQGYESWERFLRDQEAVQREERQ